MSSDLCPNGHLWQSQPGENPGQPSLVCAVCGLVADFVSDDVSATFQSPSQEGEPSRAVIPHDPTLHMVKESPEARASGAVAGGNQLPATTHHSPLTKTIRCPRRRTRK